jgi:hypothetical protein
MQRRFVSLPAWPRVRSLCGQCCSPPYVPLCIGLATVMLDHRPPASPPAAPPSFVAAPPAGRAFPAFPYPPYDIQLQFMDALYSALDQGGVGLFESPTGVLPEARRLCS